jgi:hypothetical protein
MVGARAIAGLMGAAFAAGALLLAPAVGAQSGTDAISPKKQALLNARGGLGSFTPASADPRLAASFTRAGLANTGFRFTPSGAARNSNRQVTVAVRSLSSTGRGGMDRTTTFTPQVSIAPIAYNLGVAVGWRRFALSGDIAKVDMGAMPGSREKMDVGVSYNANNWSTRLQVAKDRPTGSQPRLLTEDERYSVDLGGSYSLTRNLDVTAGLRYQSQRDRDRLPTLQDDRRDGQAVYIGTAFKF